MFNNPHLSTPDLEVLVLEYLRNCIEKYKDYTKGDGRKDTLFINFITAIKKVCYYLVTKCTPVNMYKRGKFSNYLAAFAEAESSFLFSVKHFDVERLVESFVEFISIYNPIDKVKTILHILREQREVSYKFLQVQQENLRNRNKKNNKKYQKMGSKLRNLQSFTFKNSWSYGGTKI